MTVNSLKRSLGFLLIRALRIKQNHGWLDLPQANSTVRNGVVSVVGWSHFTNSQLSSVEVFVNDEMVGFAQIGYRRTDVAKTLFDSSAEYSGFSALVGASENADEPDLLVRVRAISLDGRVWDSNTKVVTNNARRFAQTESNEDLLKRFAADPRPKVLIFTHQLDLGGGQLWLNELIKQITAEGDFAIAVSARLDGPLRPVLKEWGIPVVINPVTPSYATLDSYEAQVEELVNLAKRLNVDLVLVNTILEFFGIDVARGLGKPTIWCIHESYSPPVVRELIWPAQIMAEEVYEQFLSLFGVTDALIFEARETAEMFGPYGARNNRYLLDYGINLGEIDEYRTQNSKVEIRQRHGVLEEETVFVVLGVFSERKAQAIIVKAFQSIPPKKRVKLFLVGATETDYTRGIRKMVQELGLQHRVVLIPVVEDYYEYLLLADVILSASNVESLPRSMLEAMSFEVPVLSTAVFGVKSLITEGHDGWLVEENNLRSLTEKLLQVASLSREEINALGVNARKKMDARHRGENYGQKMSKVMIALLDKNPSDIEGVLEPIRD